MSTVERARTLVVSMEGPSVIDVPRAAMRHLRALTSLRFFAAAMIVVVHTGGLFGTPNAWFRHFDFLQAVSFFFVLSGFILTYAHPTLDGPGIRSFLRARFARLWPLHIATFLLFVLLFPTTLPGTPSGTPFPLLAANLALFHAWIPLNRSFFSFNDVTWSISAEWLFALAFPFLLAHSWRGWMRTVLVTGGLVLGTIALSVWLVAHGMISKDFGQDGRIGLLSLVYINPVARLFEFAVGMATAALWRANAMRLRISARMGTAIEVATLGLALIAMIAIAPAASHIAPHRAVGVVAYAWLVFSGGNAVLFALLIAVFALECGSVSRFLTRPFPVLMGEISFALYLVHHILLHYISVHPRTLGGITGWPAYLAFWLLTLVAAHLLWLVIERPARQWLLGRRAAPVTIGRRMRLVSLARARRWQAVEMMAFALAVVAILSWHPAPPIIRGDRPVAGFALLDRDHEQEMARSTSPDLRDVTFGGRYLLHAATTERVADGLTLRLAWRSVGTQVLAYTVVIQVLDDADDVIGTYSRPQDSLERRSADGLAWGDVFAIPPEIAANTRTIGVVLYRNPPEYLVADRGPRDNNNRRLLVPVPRHAE